MSGKNMLFQYYCHIYSIKQKLIILVLVFLNINPHPFTLGSRLLYQL